MAVKTHALFYKRGDGEGAIIVYKLYTFFVGCNALVLPLQHFNFISKFYIKILYQTKLY